MSFHEITAQDLRKYIKQHRENQYLVVDVRQPEEYQEGHIPGARLLPLPELAKSLETLPMEKELIVYCQSGARSMAASTMIEEESSQVEVYNLNGGILAWDGGVAEDIPKVRVFETSTTIEQVLMTAMNLEKGAMTFYTMVDERWGGENWSEVFCRLAEAEIGHAMMLYNILSRQQKVEEDFDAIFSGLSGDVLEGGMSLADALDRASSGKGLCIQLIELALNIEYAAFDLYRTMADQAMEAINRDIFLQISQAEKSHMGILIGALESCPR